MKRYIPPQLGAIINLEEKLIIHAANSNIINYGESSLKIFEELILNHLPKLKIDPNNILDKNYYTIYGNIITRLKQPFYKRIYDYDEIDLNTNIIESMPPIKIKDNAAGVSQGKAMSKMILEMSKQDGYDFSKDPKKYKENYVDIVEYLISNPKSITENYNKTSVEFIHAFLNLYGNTLRAGRRPNSNQPPKSTLPIIRIGRAVAKSPVQTLPQNNNNSYQNIQFPNINKKQSPMRTIVPSISDTGPKPRPPSYNNNQIVSPRLKRTVQLSDQGPIPRPTSVNPMLKQSTSKNRVPFNSQEKEQSRGQPNATQPPKWSDRTISSLKAAKKLPTKTQSSILANPSTLLSSKYPLIKKTSLHSIEEIKGLMKLEKRLVNLPEDNYGHESLKIWNEVVMKFPFPDKNNTVIDHNYSAFYMNIMTRLKYPHYSIDNPYYWDFADMETHIYHSIPVPEYGSNITNNLDTMIMGISNDDLLHFKKDLLKNALNENNMNDHKINYINLVDKLRYIRDDQHKLYNRRYIEYIDNFITSYRDFLQPSTQV